MKHKKNKLFSVFFKQINFGILLVFLTFVCWKPSQSQTNTNTPIILGVYSPSFLGNQLKQQQSTLNNLLSQ